MQLIKNILGRLFALWALIVFLPTMFIAFPLIWLCKVLWKEPVRTARFQVVARVWMSVFFFLSGIRIRIKGKEHFSKGQNYVVVCNHNSFIDITLATPFIPGANKTIAKVEMSRIPVFGLIYTVGSVLVDRKSDESRKQSFIKMREVLALGLHMCIYPEGTRNKTKEPLQYFHNGAFKLSVDSGRSIMPAVIFNTAKVLPAGKTFYFWPSKIRMEFLEPIPPDFYSIEELKDEVFMQMKSFYTLHKDQ